MKIPVFISAPKPYLQRQESFLKEVEVHLLEQGIEPMTLGRSEYDMNAPLKAIRRLMNGSCGLMCLAFRRTHIVKGSDRPDSDHSQATVSRDDTWLSSPYVQIEPAMAYQIGLPILLWKEAGVAEEGVFDRGAMGVSMPSFDLEKGNLLANAEWRQPLMQWTQLVHRVFEKKGNAPEQW